MKKYFCDWCWDAGIQTDLTNRMAEAAHVPMETREGKRKIDLCPERCLPYWSKLRNELVKINEESLDEYKRLRDALIEKYQGMAANGTEEETEETPNAVVCERSDEAPSQGQETH